MRRLVYEVNLLEVVRQTVGSGEGVQRMRGQERRGVVEEEEGETQGRYWVLRYTARDLHPRLNRSDGADSLWEVSLQILGGEGLKSVSQGAATRSMEYVCELGCDIDQCQWVQMRREVVFLDHRRCESCEMEVGRWSE
jgi:hypothetical protein